MDNIPAIEVMQSILGHFSQFSSLSQGWESQFDHFFTQGIGSGTLLGINSYFFEINPEHGIFSRQEEVKQTILNKS